MMQISDNRKNNYESLAAKRQKGLTVVLENVHDPHNIGAVLRSCDSVGVQEIYVLYTDSERSFKDFVIGKGSSSGALKYVSIHLYDDVDKCFNAIRKKYDSIWATHLGVESKELHSLDLTESVALVFGNEHSGITTETLAHCDGNYIIPQMGIIKSLNISVACAVSLYEGLRQRKAKNMYEISFDESNVLHKARYDQYVKSHMDSLRNIKREHHHHIKKY